jgi:hypothetical protein
MKDYTVLKTYENHAVGDIIQLNLRQAKYLLLSGNIQPVAENKPKKEDK